MSEKLEGPVKRGGLDLLSMGFSRRRFCYLSGRTSASGYSGLELMITKPSPCDLRSRTVKSCKTPLHQ